MPHIILECSDNIIEIDFQLFFKKIHIILSDRLPTQLFACKSRLIRHKDFRSGDGHINNAFAHLNICVMPGRSQVLLNQISEYLLEIMKDFYKESCEQKNMQLSVEINELPLNYKKFLT